jgi:predicted MFS family arabinose efflux permease
MHVGAAGVMMEPVTQEFGWSRTEYYLGISLVSVVNMVLATFMGMGIDSFGPRRIAIVTSSILFAAVAFMSTADGNLWAWWARWLLVGVGISAMPTVWITAVAARFDVSRGLAVAVALSGSGIGTSLAPMISHALFEEYGWRGAFIGLPAIWAAVAIPLILLFFHGPERKPTGADKGAPKPAVVELPGLTRQEGFRSATYWILLFAGTGAILGGVALVMNLFPVLTSTGIPRGAAATVAGLIGFATITGRIVGGWLLDRYEAKYIASVATISAVAMPIGLLLFPGSVPIAAISIVIYGLMGGAKIGALAYLSSRHLGQRAFGSLYGAINASIALAVGIAGLGANYIYDLTQSYEPVMWAAVPTLVLSALLYLLLGDYPDISADKAEQAA